MAGAEETHPRELPLANVNFPLSEETYHGYLRALEGSRRVRARNGDEGQGKVRTEMSPRINTVKSVLPLSH